MSTKTVLFVDDDPFSRDIAQRAIGRLDCQYLFFQTICEVFDNIDMIEPKLVVLDLGMTGLDGVYDSQAGIEINLALRCQYRNRFPILILTGTDDPEIICKCLRSGADDYYSKSHDMTGLVKRIAAWLVVDYSAGHPQRKREATADQIEKHAATHGIVTAKDWRQVAMAQTSRNPAAEPTVPPAQRPLGDLFAWQPDSR